MVLPKKFQSYPVNYNKVNAQVREHSQLVFRQGILDHAVFNNLADFSVKGVDIQEVPKMDAVHKKLMAFKAETSAVPTPGEKAEQLVNDTYDLVVAGESQTEFNPKYKDVILVVGNSGTGKSTLVQFIAGDLSKLKAVKKGSGFVIEDEDDRISSKDNNSQSKTLFPELIVNDQLNLAFYDCPGFKDNRGSAFAMAASHFTKLVFDESDKIKIHICVDYAVANGAERGQAFIEAIKHVGEFMKDAEKFKISFSMTATRVPRTYVFDEELGDEVPKTDAAEIKGIGDTIKTDIMPLLRSQMEKETEEKTRQMLRNALDVFEGLTAMENEKYTRIGLFRTPIAEGPLSKSKAMMNSKATIISAIDKQTKFVAVSKRDFNFTVDAATKVEMLNVGTTLNKNLKNSMDKIGTEILKHCAERMFESKNWRKTEKSMKNLKTTLDEYEKKLKALDKLEKSFISQLDMSLQEVDVSISKQNMRYLDRQISCLSFLNNMFEEISTTVPMASLDEATKFVSRAVFWYKTLYAVYETLSTDFYQANKEKYNVANLDDWGKSTQNKGLRVSADTASRFFKLLKIDVDALGDFSLSEVRMNELNAVIHLTLVEETNIRVTPDGVLLATGPFVILSRVVEEYKKKENQVNKINISATCVLYVDKDFIAPGRHMIITALKWKVKGNCKISLDGRTGEDRSGSAEAGRGATPGEDGTPGGSGKPAGHFVGIADSVENAELLTIYANGGRGGRGQTGGKGGAAAPGENAKKPTNTSSSTPPGRRDIDYEMYLGWITEKDRFSYNKKSIRWRVFGTKARDGERGGRGGSGGFGGPKGEVIMVIFSPMASQYPIIRNSNGREGENGSGGAGGDGAKHGNDMKAKYWDKYVTVVYSAGWDDEGTFDTGYSNTGSRGESGGNKEGRKMEQQVSPTMMAASLNDFKAQTIRFAASSPLQRAALKDLMARVDETNKCNDLYNVSSYLNEMTLLESIYFSIFKSIDTTPFYRSLLQRIKSYADSHKPNTKKVERLAMSVIYASCLSKICNLQLGSKSQGIIVNLDAYIGRTLERIDTLAAIEKRSVVKEFRDSYHESIELKVKEANHLIKSKVDDGIEKVLRSMDDKLDALVKEVLDKTQDAKDKKAELIEQKKQMEKAFIIKTCLNVLKMGATLASCAGPIGAAVGGVVTAGATIGESFVVEPDVEQGNGILVPPGVSSGLESLGDFVAETRAKKFEKFEEQLKSVEEELKDPPVDLKEVNNKMNSIRERLDKEKAKTVADGDEDAAKARDEKVAELEKEFKGVLQEKRTGLEEQISKGDKAKKNILDKVNKLQNTLKVIESGIDVYTKYKSDKKKLDVISDSIDQADEAIHALEGYEIKIKSAMFPMVRKMRDDVNKVKASLSTKSQVALDVTQWEIQGTLRVVKTTLEKAMEGYAAQGELTACFDSLSEAMNLLIHIYDRLENYHDQQKLGDFIANIGAPAAYGEILRGTEYENDVRALDMTIQSNLVLVEYNCAMQAFLQWVFPFAKRYMEKTNLPDSLKPIKDQETLKELVVTAKNQLKSIKDSIVNYWATIPDYTKFIINGGFFANDKLGGPFYMWDAFEYRNVIRDIFSGHEVTLFADVRNSGKFVNMNADRNASVRQAIRFAMVYIRFNLAKKYEEKPGDADAKKKNADRQARFENVLEHFVVNMTHTGTSHYDFRNNFYVIHGDPVVLRYSIRKNASGTPDIQSESRDKVLKGDLLLSPYTLWTVRLTADVQQAFNDMKEFIDDISLELAGEGKYIFDDRDELAAYHLNPENYYQIDGKYRETIESK